jgi:MFS transporter, UMF1 family
MMHHRSRGVLAWCLYDWAHSAFGTIVTTFIFAPYFVASVASTPTGGTVLWGHTTSLAAGLVALSAPVLGAIADHGGRRKLWLGIFTTACTLLSCALYGVAPSTDYVLLTLVLFGGALMASDLAWVFYNSLLPTLVDRQHLGRVSGWAWSLGYFGGMLSLVLALVLFVREGAPLAVLDTGQSEPIRATAILAGLWVTVFALPLYLLTPDPTPRSKGLRAAVRAGMGELGETLRHARRYRNILLLLCSWLFASNGLATLFGFAGIYAAGTFGMELDEIILFAIAVNVTAGIGAASFGWIDDRLGPKRTILGALGALMVLGLILVATESRTVLWVGGLALGVFVGPAQSATRSFMARLIPEGMEGQMFGLYALSGKVTAFAGPFVLALVTDLFDSQRAGMATILIFLLLGAAVLLRVEEPPQPKAAQP